MKHIKQKKASKRALLGSWLGIIIAIWTTIYLWPRSRKSKPPYFDHKRPLVIAHQGGKHLAPSSTLEAFKNAMALGVDVMEFDVHMTKDGHLVAIHDHTVDRTTNGTGLVNEMTLEEVQDLDAGAYFQDVNGVYGYRNQGVYIPTVEEIFTAIPHMKWNIEIKDTNFPELYLPIAKKLWKIVQDYQLEEDVLFASFDQKIIDILIDITEGKALVSGGRGEVTKFVLLHKLLLNGLYPPYVNALQIPTSDSHVNLKDHKFIRGARKRGMEIHYWTINDEQEMRELIELGADGIITDRPDILLKVLNE